MTELKSLAEKDGSTINQWIAMAVAEKLSAIRAVDFFNERASRVKNPRETFNALLAKMGTEEPREDDRL